MLIAAIVLLCVGLSILLWSQTRAQAEIGRLRLLTLDAIADQQPEDEPRRELSAERERLAILADDCDWMVKQVAMGKCHSRAYCCERHNFSQWRWSKARATLRHLKLYDDSGLLCGYSEARRTLRRYIAEQVILAERGDYVTPA